jgi:cobalt/nickel transport system permease protein
LVTAAALGALVFAAQMFNVQVLPYSSVHLIGGVLLAWVLGPAAGLLTMSVILALQATLLGDGGVMELGANIVNMALIPSGLVALVRQWHSEVSVTRTVAAIALTCFVATLAAALAIVGEISVGRSLAELDGFGAFASQMLWMHMLAGVLEGIVTVALVAAVSGLATESKAPARLSLGSTAMILAASLAIVLLSEAGLASSAPDFYESAAQALKPLEA